MARQFDLIGKGWKFEPKFNKKGGVEVSNGEDNIKENIRIILSTRKGEYPLNPDFGCEIQSYSFGAVTDEFIGLLQSDVEEALTNWEPRITIDNIYAKQNPNDDGRVDITIGYVVNVTREPDSFIYPFYLTEKGAL